jgi:hypothetical protein
MALRALSPPSTDNRARHVAGKLGGEEQYDVCDLVGAIRSAGGHAELERRSREIGTLETSREKRCLHHSRAYTIHPDAVARGLERRDTRQVNDTCLYGVVGGAPPRPPTARRRNWC